MANLVAADITVTFLNQRRINGLSYFNVQLAFGDSSKTYPAGGVPVSGGALGCPNTIQSLTVYDKGTSGYEWSFDRTNNKLVALQSAAGSAVGSHTHVQDAHTHTQTAHTHDILLKNAAVADGASARVNAGANLLGANTGSDLTITGAGANGGVVNATAVNANATATNQAATISFNAVGLAQPSTVAIAAQVLKCEVIGW